MWVIYCLNLNLCFKHHAPLIVVCSPQRELHLADALQELYCSCRDRDCVLLTRLRSFIRCRCSVTFINFVLPLFLQGNRAEPQLQLQEGI